MLSRRTCGCQQNYFLNCGIREMSAEFAAFSLLRTNVCDFSCKIFWKKPKYNRNEHTRRIPTTKEVLTQYWIRMYTCSNVYMPPTILFTSRL